MVTWTRIDGSEIPTTGDIAAGALGSISSYSTTCDPGSFLVTGTDALLLASPALGLVCDPGAFTVTGTDASFPVGYVVSLDSGSFTVTGTDARLEKSELAPVAPIKVWKNHPYTNKPRSRFTLPWDRPADKSDLSSVSKALSRAHSRYRAEINYLQSQMKDAESDLLAQNIQHLIQAKQQEFDKVISNIEQEL